MPGPHLEKADNGKWYVHWTEGRRSRRVSARTEDRSVAEHFLATLILTSAEQQVAKSPVHTVAELWSLYYEARISKFAAAKDTARFSWNRLEPHFGNLKLSHVNQAVVDAYERDRKKPRKGLCGSKMVTIPGAQSGTIRRELAALKACFGWCADPRIKIISKTDVPAFALPADGEPRDRWLKMHELQSLFTAAGALRRGKRLSRGERFLWLALETSARKSAICELTWDRVDFETGMIHYDVPGRVKTKKRRTSVPISKALRPVLERALDERTGPYVLDNTAEVWKAIAAIAEHAAVDGVSPHVLRHTAATHMARRGVPLWIVANILGNSLGMVEKVYAKHCPQAMAAAVEKISGGVLETTE